MKRFCLAFCLLAVLPAAAREYTLRNDRMSITLDDRANLVSLKNRQTGHDYAGGAPLWRLFYESAERKEIPVLAPAQRPSVRKEGRSLTFTYDHLEDGERTLAMSLVLTVTLEEDKVRFASRLHNEEPHTIVRELHYPLVGKMDLPADHQLMTTTSGGQLFPNPVAYITAKGNSPAYKAPAQRFRQLTLQYPDYDVSSNCFALIGAEEGLYFGSHDPTFQNTWHGLRTYPDATGAFTLLEAGLYKYPHCVAGETWACDANVVAAYSGDWRETSRLYKAWASTWWDHQTPPRWVRQMNGWQRLIFKHQYGEYLFRYPDLYGRVRAVGDETGIRSVLLFGWWQEGMDHGNPDYSPDASQGGDAALREAVARYQADGNRLMLYFNGKLIDRESRFYRSGAAAPLSFKDNTGSEIVEWYKFSGDGSFTGAYDTRSFVVADTRDTLWRRMMLDWADRALSIGASSVFYDQMGGVERSGVNWDTTGEFPIPHTTHIADKAETLRLIREHVRARDPEFALGTEHLVDVTSQYCDYVHTMGVFGFVDWFRYTFPDVIFSDRGIYDDTDAERRVNYAVLKGLCNDVAVFRCRGLADEAPRYAARLREADRLKDRYADLLKEGRFTYTEGFTLDGEGLEGRSFRSGRRMAVVVTDPGTKAVSRSAFLAAPGWRYVESSFLGDGSYDAGRLTLAPLALAVVIFEQDS